MSFVYARPAGTTLFFGAGFSVSFHGFLVALWLAQTTAITPPKEEGIQGRELIDLAEIEMIMAVSETNLPDGDPADDSQAAMESPAEQQEAKSSNDPIL
ncbi:MAG: energy transducer TonB, partial [Paracoccaceae bacterium]